MPLKIYRKKGITKISASELSLYHRRMRKYQGLEYSDVLNAEMDYFRNKNKFLDLGLELDVWFAAVKLTCESRETHFNPVEFKQHFNEMTDLIQAVIVATPKKLSDLKPLLQANMKKLRHADDKLHYQTSFANKAFGLKLLIASLISTLPALGLFLAAAAITSPFGLGVAVGVVAIAFIAAATVMCVAGLVTYFRGASKKINDKLEKIAIKDPVKLTLNIVIDNVKEVISNLENDLTTLNTINVERELRRAELERILPADPDNKEREQFLHQFRSVCTVNHLICSAKDEMKTVGIAQRYETVLVLDAKQKDHLERLDTAVFNRFRALKTQRDQMSGEFQAEVRNLILKNSNFKPAQFFAPTYATAGEQNSDHKNFFKPWKSPIVKALG